MLSIRSRTAENRAAAFEKGSVALICFERGSEALQKSGVAPRHAKTAWIKHYGTCGLRAIKDMLKLFVCSILIV